jgi:hypothetical protein
VVENLILSVIKGKVAAAKLINEFIDINGVCISGYNNGRFHVVTGFDRIAELTGCKIEITEPNCIGHRDRFIIFDGVTFYEPIYPSEGENDTDKV